tara:strand:- start:2590 stop:3120 length:531 start_codon:yes stop_codon:yes gene_type:complete
LKKNKINNSLKIGILGGTFDPPHKGHVYISKVALKKLKLNKIFWIVTKKNPLKKKPYLKKKLRIKLSKKITKNDKKIFVKYFDDKIKSSNTINLLRYVKRKNKKANLFYLIGADNLKKFHKWKSWKKIPEFAKIVVFPRKNYILNSVATKKLNKKDLIYIKSKKINISSSLIRKFW